MIFRARTVVTMDGAPIENGAIATDRDRVVDLGPFAELRARNSGDVVDLGERALMPGLINAHCHLDYTCLRGKIPRQRSFTDWIRAINAEKAKLSPNDYLASINDGFAEAKRFGTTTVLNLTAFPELVSRIRPAIRTLWFPELIDVRGKVDVDLVAKFDGLAPHALYTASAALFQLRAELLTTHIAESREEMEMFRDARGELYEFLKETGRDMSDCGGTTPLGRFIEIAQTNNWIVAHLNELTESDFELLARSRSKFHIVHCPRSHEYFRHSAFQSPRLRDLGFNICIGTDSLASNDDLNLFAEMRTFADKFPSVSPENILQMVTINPARALKRENRLGKICRDADVDLIAVPCSSSDVFEEIVAFEGEPWLMRC